MPRLVRRRSLAERVQDYLNPHDWLMWISEELETSEYPWDEWAYIIGFVINVVFVVGRANSSSRTLDDDVFADDLNDSSSRRGFIGPLLSILVLGLTVLSFANAGYVFLRKRHYRLFEASAEGKAPATSSAHRVRVNSTPSSSSPFQTLASFFETPSAGSRAHPDAKRDVWQLSVWDPTPLNLKLFCAFSPGHVLLYWLLLPVSVADPQPSTTVATALALAALLSVQLAYLQNLFSQQSRDLAIIHKEVMHEYDTKFVHPLSQPLMRNVGTQFDDDEHTFDACDLYQPTVVLNRGFRTHINPNYTSIVDPENLAEQHQTPSQHDRPYSRASQVMRHGRSSSSRHSQANQSTISTNESISSSPLQVKGILKSAPAPPSSLPASSSLSQRESHGVIGGLGGLGGPRDQRQHLIDARSPPAFRQSTSGRGARAWSSSSSSLAVAKAKAGSGRHSMAPGRSRHF